MSKLRRVKVVFLALMACVACGAPTTLRGQMDRAEGQGRAAETALDEAEAKLGALDPDGARTKLDEARKLLADPNIKKYPEHQMLRDRLEADDKRVGEVRDQIAIRDHRARLKPRSRARDNVRLRFCDRHAKKRAESRKPPPGGAPRGSKGPRQNSKPRKPTSMRSHRAPTR